MLESIGENAQIKKEVTMKKPIKFLIIIATIMVMMCFSIHVSATELPAISADVNFDGSVNSVDLLTVKKILVGIGDPFDALDVNLDGKVNAKDALYVIKVIKDEINLDNIVSLTSYTVDRHTYQKFLFDMTFENISEGEGVWYVERITFISGSTNDLCYEELLHGYSKTGKYDDGLGVRLGWGHNWPVYKAEVEVLSDPVKLRNLFIEHGIELPRYPATVCMIDSEGCDPVYWIKCGEEDYFIKYKWIGELLDYVFDPCTKEEFIEYAREEKATLIVNGVEVEDEHAVVGSQYCLVSITNLLRAMDAEIEWKPGIYYADITYNDKKFVLEESYWGNIVFYELGEDVDYFMMAGGSPVWDFLDCDILIDDEHIGHVVAALVNDGKYNHRFFDVDYENHIINITTSIEE